MANVIKKINTGGTTYPIDRTFTVTGLSTVAGNGTSGSYLSVRWYCSGVEGLTAPYDGMRLMIKIPLAGVATAGAMLSINGNTASEYHPLAYNKNTVFTTHYAVDTYKIFVYDASATMTAYKTSGTPTTITGVWKAESNYDSNTNYYPIRSYTSGLQISSYSGSTNCQLYVPYATNTQAGVVSTAAQTFAGAKTFNDSIIVAESDATLTMFGNGINSSYDDGTFVASFDLYAGDDMTYLYLNDSSGNRITFLPTQIEKGSLVYTYPSASGQLATTDNITQVKTQTTGSATSIQMKFWQGTQSQYDAITTKDSNTLYIIKTS